MIENILINLGLKCGTKKNFSTQILNSMRLNSGQSWYFLTPLKITEKNGLRETTIQLAFPFLAQQSDISELEAIKRISQMDKCYRDGLIKELRKFFIVPDFSFLIIPFWANEKTAERNELKDFAGTRIHILSATVTVKFRDTWFSCCEN